MSKHSNLAYDLTQFEEKKKPEIREVKSVAKTRKSPSAFKAMIYLILAAVILSLFLYARAVQTELSYDYIKTEKTLNTLKGDNARLQIELERSLSLKNIEEIARSQFGLSDVEDRQIKYVNYNNESKVEVKEADSIWEKAIEWAKGFFAR